MDPQFRTPSYHHYGTLNFEVAPKLSENMCIAGVMCIRELDGLIFEALQYIIMQKKYARCR